MSPKPRVLEIRVLNDALRQLGHDGITVITQGVSFLSYELQAKIYQAVQTFNEFTPKNDPHGEHDLGLLMVDGQRVIFKIDYYDQTLCGGSEDPSNPKMTKRVITIMLAHEY
jgi:hypothetical protein